jgi:hypothetical protein
MMETGRRESVFRKRSKSDGIDVAVAVNGVEVEMDDNGGGGWQRGRRLVRRKRTDCRVTVQKGRKGGQSRLLLFPDSARSLPAHAKQTSI